MASATARRGRSRAAFLPAKGWSVFWSPLPWGDDGNDEAQVIWATNGPVLGDDAETGWPINTVTQLPSDGIVVCATMAPEFEDGPSIYPEASIPLRLDSGMFFTGQYENQALNVSLYRVAAHVKDQYITADVYFGVPNPGAAMKQAAAAQLSRLVLKAAD